MTLSFTLLRMMPCSSDLVPSSSLEREREGGRRVLANATVQRADLKQAERGVVDGEGQGEVVHEEVALGGFAEELFGERERENS